MTDRRCSPGIPGRGSPPAAPGKIAELPEERVHVRLERGPHVYAQPVAARQRLDVRPDHVAHVDVVAGLLAVPIDDGRLPLDEPGAEDRDDARLAVRVLPGTIDVRVAQRRVLEAELHLVIVHVVLDADLGDAVRRHGPQRVLLVGPGSTPAPRTPPPPEEAKMNLRTPFRPRSLQEVQRPEDVHLGVEDRVLDRLPHVDLRRVMVDDLRPERPHRLRGRVRLDVPENEPRLFRHVLLLPEERLSRTSTSCPAST
jgi:hypothetical protein